MIVLVLLSEIIGGLSSSIYCKILQLYACTLSNDTHFKVLIEVEAALTAGDYDLRMSKGNREIKRLFIQNETLMTEYRSVLKQKQPLQAIFSDDWVWYRVQPEHFSELKFIVEELIHGVLVTHDWYIHMDASTTDQTIQAFYIYDNDYQDLWWISNYKWGRLANGASVKIDTGGININTFESTQPDANILLTEENAWITIDICDNCCDICKNGKYVFDESISRTGRFEFQG